MKPLLLLLALTLGGCVSPVHVGDAGAKQAGGFYLVRIDDSGAVIDTSGSVIRREDLVTMLERKQIDRGIPIRITVIGTQKLGVLAASEMFTGLGFKSVKIDLVLTDPMKKEPNQAPEPTAPSGRGSS